MPRTIAWNGLLLFVIASAGLADGENLAPNPSVEEEGEGVALKSWRLRNSAGEMTIERTTQQPHSGKACASLRLNGWKEYEDADGAKIIRKVEGGIILAPNQGADARGALPCRPNTTYGFSFWYRGDVPSATVRAIGWPSPDASADAKRSLAHRGERMYPAAKWQQYLGSFRTAADTERFVLEIQAGGRKDREFALGELCIDDVQIVPKMLPDGQLRAIFYGMPQTADRVEGIAEIERELDRLKEMGLNSLFVYTSTLYLSALDRPELRTDNPEAAWDALAEVIKAAKVREMQVHVWYTPWVYKGVKEAVELRDHPEWAAVRSDGIAYDRGLCFIRPEVRNFQLEMIRTLLRRYPDMAGIHIEEPGFRGKADYCYCDYCKKFCREWFDIDICDDPTVAKPMLHNLAAFMSTDFFARLQRMVVGHRPSLWLSANGSAGANPDWPQGRDWTTWARRGYIDFYSPQLYFESVEQFIRSGEASKSCLGNCGLAPAIALTWSGMHPRRQDPETVKAEILASVLQLGGRGFIIFHEMHLVPEQIPAIRQAVAELDNKGREP